MAVSSEEIEKIFKAPNDDKAPGPDGWNAVFYKSQWDIIKPNVISAAKGFFRTGKILKEINKTHIVLIPKSSEAKSVKDFRPISLCNLIYKITTKVMANRLQPILPLIISTNQCAFVNGRSIFDAVLMTNKILHDFNWPGA